MHSFSVQSTQHSQIHSHVKRLSQFKWIGSSGTGQAAWQLAARPPGARTARPRWSHPASPAAILAGTSDRRWEATAYPTNTFHPFQMLNDYHSSSGSGPPGPVRPPGSWRRGPPGREPPGTNSADSKQIHFMSKFATTKHPMEGNALRMLIRRKESLHPPRGLARSIGSCRSTRHRRGSASWLTGSEGLRHCAPFPAASLYTNRGAFQTLHPIIIHKLINRMT